MYAKGITILVMGMSLVSAASAAREKPFKPDFDALRGIEFGDGGYPGWRGSFFSNGRASLSRTNTGSGAWGDALEGSFSIKEIYALVAPHLKKPPADKKGGLDVVFFFAPSATNTEKVVYFYIDDKDVMRTIMHGLRDKVVPGARTRFEELLSTYPLVPGDEPEPFAYGWDDEGYRAALEAVNKMLAEKPNWVIVGDIDDDTVPVFVTRGVREKPSPAPAAEETQGAVTKPENGNETKTPAPSRRPCLYGTGVLAVLCAGIAFWFMRRKR